MLASHLMVAFAPVDSWPTLERTRGLRHGSLHCVCPLDRKLLGTIIVNYKGGPVGIEALAATLQLESDVLIEVVEPYLLKTGFLTRTSQGRKASDKAYLHLGFSPDGKGQSMELFAAAKRKSDS